MLDKNVKLNLLESSYSLDEYPDVKAEVEKIRKEMPVPALDFLKHSQDYCNKLSEAESELSKKMLNNSTLYPEYAKVMIMVIGIIDYQNVQIARNKEDLKTLQEKLSRYEDND